MAGADQPSDRGWFSALFRPPVEETGPGDDEEEGPPETMDELIRRAVRRPTPRKD